MPDNTSNAAAAEGVTSKQEIPSSSNTSADEKTPTELPTTPDTDNNKNGSTEVSSATVGEVVLTPMKEKSESTSTKKGNTPKKATGKLTNTKKSKLKPQMSRGSSADAKTGGTPKKITPQATLSRQSTVNSSNVSAPGTPKKSVRLDISLDGENSLGTPKKKKTLNRFRSKSPKKAAGKGNIAQRKPQPLRSSTPKRPGNNSVVRKEKTPEKREPGIQANGVETMDENSEESGCNGRVPMREKSATRQQKPQRKIFVASTKPPKIKPRTQSPSKAKKGKPSAWR